MDRLPFRINHNSRPAKPPAPEVELVPANSPDNSYALANVAAINPADFPDNAHIILNGLYVFTTRHSSAIPPGHIGLNASQRVWAELSLNSRVRARLYDIKGETGSQPYIGTMNIEISFKNKAKAVSTKFDQDEMANVVKEKFKGQVFSPTQKLFFDFKGSIFELTVQSIQVVDITDLESSGPMHRGIQTKGVLLPQSVVNFFKGPDGLVQMKASVTRPRNDAVLRSDFKFEDMGVGGLDKEFTTIFRRAFASRIFPPAVVEQLGISHVKGMLLFGPPGTGKTLIARRIGKMLNAKEPKIVNGPEILSKYVGSSEENIRNLFVDAEAEYKAKGDESSLHIIIFDELDSVFKQRGSRGDGTGVGDNVVNQLLAKMDGVDQLNNILVIGMTNRLDLIDSALLRPGRFEVQVEIHLPDEEGRVQIFEIQTKKMRENGKLARDVNFAELAAMTKNFSGAEIEGLVKSATSFAINEIVKIGGGQTKIDSKAMTNIQVTRAHFLAALDEVKPAFGVSEDDLKTRLQGGLIHYSPRIDEILAAGQSRTRLIRESTRKTLMSVLLHGPAGSGKTALAAKIALDSGFPLVRLISPEGMGSMSESAKISYLDNMFRDAYKSKLNVLVVDNIERLIDWSPIGPRFSNNILQALCVHLTRTPPGGGRLLVLATTSSYSVLQQLDILSCFDSEIAVPNIQSLDEFNIVLEQLLPDPQQRVAVLNKLGAITTQLNLGIKKATSYIETAKFSASNDTVNELVELVVGSRF